MKVQVVAVGKIKEKGVREAVDDYLARIKRYAGVDEVELKDADAAEVAQRVRKALPERARVVALEVEGERWSSPELAKFVGRCEQGAVPCVSFVIGGAYGLPPEITKGAHVALSLSAMTLPHRLARLILVEQVYRAFTILRNEPYSH